MNLKQSCLLVLVLSGPVSAQYISPGGLAAVEGTANNVFPFGNTAVPFRFCQVHDDVPAMSITGLQFRHNATTTASYPSYSLTMNAWISTAVTTSATISSTFDSNHGLDKVQVVTNRIYALAPSVQGELPGQFVLDFPLDVPFAFAGGGASLCWEVQVTAKTNTSSIVYDAVTNPNANPAMQSTRFGTGCLATGRTLPMTAAQGGSVSWTTGTGTLTVSGSNLLANGVVFFCVGFDKAPWNGNPLPAVIPTSSAGPSGTCTLYVNFLFPQLAIASATGTATLTVPYVPDPAWNGMTVYTQILGGDTAANAFGVTASNATVHQIVAPYGLLPVARVFLSASLGPIGTASPSSCLVTRFY